MKKVRLVIQTFFILLIIGGASLRNLGIWLADYIPELKGFCPFGAITTLGTFLDGPSGRLWVLSGIILVTFLFRSSFCTCICPLGATQDFIGRIGRKFFKKRYNPNLGFIRYIVLGLVLISAFGWIALPLDLFNPSYALVHMWTASAAISSVVLLIIILVVSLVSDRPWCQIFCPLGGFLGIISRFSPKNKLKPVIKGILIVLIFFAPFGISTVVTKVQESFEVKVFETSPKITLIELAKGLDMEYSALLNLLGLPENYDGTTLLMDVEEDNEELTYGQIKKRVGIQ